MAGLTLVSTDFGPGGVLLLEPAVHRDARGFFLETYHERAYEAVGLKARFVQDCHSRSTAGTLRGLHAQRRRPQGKLVRVIEGEIYDVAVDLRPGSATLGRWVGYPLSAESFRQVYVPPGFLHGFCVMTPTVQVEYKCTEFYDPSDEVGVVWNDPDLAIPWPVKEPILSAKDAALPKLKDVLKGL